MATVFWAAVGAAEAVATTPMFDPPDIDGVADTVRDERTPIRIRLKAAAEVLRFGFEPAIPDVMSLLRGLYRDPSAEVRGSAIRVLHAARLPSAEAFDLLAEALHDASPDVRAVAVAVLIRRDHLSDRTEPRLPGAESFELLAGALRDSSLGVREAAVKTVIQVAWKAPPELRQGVFEPAIFAALAEGRDEFREELIETISKYGLWRPPVGRGLATVLGAENAVLRKKVARIIRYVDPPGMDAVAELARLSKDPDWKVRQKAAESLGHLRRNPATAVPALVDFLRDSSPEVREAAAEALGFFGGTASSAAPALQQALGDPDEYVRKEAVDTLKWIEEAIDYTEPALVSRLGSPDARTRMEAIEAFSWVARDMGIQGRDSRNRTTHVRPDARWLTGASLEAIMKATSDPDEGVAVTAIRVLGRFGPPSDDVVSLLHDRRDDDRAKVRKSATRELRRFGFEPQEVESDLVKLLRSADKDVRANAYRELQDMNLDLDVVVPVLVAIVEEESGAVRETAARELRRVAWKSELAQLALENTVEDIGQPAVADMRPVTRKGKDIGHLSDDDLRATLEEQLRQPRTDGFRVYASILRPVSRTGRVGAVREVLLRHLRDPDFQVRTATAESLGILSPEQGAFAVPVLAKLVRQDDSAQVREAAAFALGKLGHGKEGAVEALTAALSDSDSSVRHSADFSLSYFGPKAAPAIPVLVGLLDGMLLANCGNFGLRLSKIDPAAAEALLVERMQDDRRKVRRNAIATFAGLREFDTGFRERRTRILVAAIEGAYGRGIEQVVAVRSLHGTDLSSKHVRRVTLSALRDADHRVRNALLSLFRNSEVHYDSVIAAVADALNDPHPEIRPAAAYTLARISPFSAAPAIRAALQREQDSQARMRIENTLAKLEKY